MVDPIDRVTQVAMRARPSRGEVFPDGFGDPAILDEMFEVFGPETPIRPFDVAWGSPVEEQGITRTPGGFDSPWDDYLSGPALDGVVELVEPIGGSDRVVLLLPAWGDETFVPRRRLARILARRGISSLLLMNPLFGPRRIHEGHLPIRTVSDFCLQALITVRESRALLDSLRSDRQVGVSGFSMGAGYSVATSLVLPFPAAVALSPAAHSPAWTFTKGIMGTRLAPRFDEPAKARLFEILDAPGACHRDPLPHHATSVLLAAKGDGFVVPHEARRLHAHWQGSELREIPGGHARTWLFKKSELADGIERSFDRTYA